jgi:hypothetical protein
MPEVTDSVGVLVERFRENVDQYTSQHYNETQVRREFLDPFFGLLGWDIANVQGYAEPYKDVVHEDLVRVEGQATARTTGNSRRNSPVSFPFRIVDPACGSGSFLIQAYQFLLDRHFAYYIENGPEIFSRGRRPRLLT